MKIENLVCTSCNQSVPENQFVLKILPDYLICFTCYKKLVKEYNKLLMFKP